MSTLNSLYISSLLVVVSFPFSASHSNRQEMTILDYYRKVPQQYLPLKAKDSKGAQQSAISIQDLENGYLQIRQQGNETYEALSLFKRPDGSDLIAIETRACPAGCTSNLTFLTFENDKWANVTSDVLPVIDDKAITASLAKQVEMKSTFEPRLLYTLLRGGSAIEVREHWSGVEIGRLDWSNGRFAFKVLNPEEQISNYTVLASTSNSLGDRIQIIGVNPQSPSRLTLKGFFAVKIAYELKSARACVLFGNPATSGESRLDTFTSGSMVVREGSGVVTRWFGFNNEAHVDHFEVVMSDKNLNRILTLNYNVDASWEGTLECPSFRVGCFSNSKDSAIPVGCMVYPSGLSPDHRLTYNWTLSNGVIVSGQGTRSIKIDTSGEEYVTASVELGGLATKCPTSASFRSTPNNVGRPSR
jgi:hypothetical protein